MDNITKMKIEAAEERAYTTGLEAGLTSLRCYVSSSKFWGIGNGVNPTDVLLRIEAARQMGNDNREERSRELRAAYKDVADLRGEHKCDEHNEDILQRLLAAETVLRNLLSV